MTDPDTILEQRLATTFGEIADAAPTDPDLLGTVRARAGRRWPGRHTVAAAAVVAAVAAVAVSVAVVAGGDDKQAVPASYECPASLRPDVLPAWARGGFSDPEPRMPYVLGEDGGIVAVVFGDPLRAPPADDHNNKVLWVVRSGGGPLTIRASRSPEDEPLVIESVTGPSYLDLPVPGCWHLELAWGEDQADSLDLRFH